MWIYMPDINSIDWTNMNAQITEHFTVGEALYLPTFKIYHKPGDEEKANIVNLFTQLELVRTSLGDHPINILCCIRPVAVNCDNPAFWGRNYNQLVGGALGSAHIVGMAADFTVSTITCDEVRSLVVPELNDLQMRCENKPGSGWVHLDIRDPGPSGKRFFLP
jgi:hypothetical protein